MFFSVAPSIAELARGEKIAYSLTHSPSLFDLAGTEAFAWELSKNILNVSSPNVQYITTILRNFFG